MSMGSNPVFPKIFYNHSLTYVRNLININTFHKNLAFQIIFSKRNYIFIKFLRKLNFINKFFIIRQNKQIFLKVYPFYFKTQQIGKTFHLLSKPSHKFFISFKALRLVDKRMGNSFFIISSSKGLMTHKEALKFKSGGLLVGVFSL